MKLLVTLEDLKERMTIDPDLVGVDDALASAITASQLRIASMLDSQLETASYTNIFFLDSEAYSSLQPGGLFRLYLKSGLLSATPTPVVSVCSTWNGTYTTVPTTDYNIDMVRGICYIGTEDADGSAYSEQYIKVAFTAGYDKAAQIPDWLKEAIMGYAPVVLNFSQVTNRSNEAQKMYQTSGDHALAIAAPYTRNVGFLTRPLF